MGKKLFFLNYFYIKKLLDKKVNLGSIFRGLKIVFLGLAVLVT